MTNDKETMLSNPHLSNFDKYFNASNLSDTTVQVLNESGEILGTLNAHKIILCQNDICKKMIENNETILIVGSLDAAETFINYLYSHKIAKTKITPDLIRIAVYFEDLFLMDVGESAVIDNLSRLPFEQQVDEFLLALKNDNYFTWTSLAKHIAANYSRLKTYNKEFSRILNDKQASQALFDALGESNEQFKNRLNCKKQQFELQLSWMERAVHSLEINSSKWQFEVYRVIEDNEEWLYFDFHKLTTDTMVLQDVFVKLLPNPEQNLDCEVSEKTCGGKYRQTRFLNWKFVMDPKNGYINKGMIKLEIEYRFIYLAARKTGGYAVLPKRAKKSK